MIRRIVYLIFLIGTGVLVSNKGGSAAYMLFYFAVMLPILAVFYTTYVYIRFRISQDISHKVVKGEKVPYDLIIANEDILPYTNVALKFYSKRVDVVSEEGSKDFGQLSLLPQEIKHVHANMYCKYRGTYPVGVKSVVVTDFMGLFSITYPMRSPVRLTATPRILPLKRLQIPLTEQDSKNQLFFSEQEQEILSADMRKYQTGDPTKWIHWKNSAKAGELLVRPPMPEELPEHMIFIDLTPVEGEELERLQKEDDIIEAAVAFAFDYCQKQIPVRIVYYRDGLNELQILGKSSFDVFYNQCADIPFVSEHPLEKVWDLYSQKNAARQSCVLITEKSSDILNEYIQYRRQLGDEVLLVNTGELNL